MLKEKLNYKGLILTDALNMKGASNYAQPGDIDLAAILAGNDILLMSENVSKGISSIINEYNTGSITEERLSYSVKKILKAKYKVGLNKFSPISTYDLDNDLNSISDEILNEKLVENSLTVIKNKENIIPIKDLSERVGYLSFGNDSNTSFFSYLNKYSKVNYFSTINDIHC